MRQWVELIRAVIGHWSLVGKVSEVSGVLGEWGYIRMLVSLTIDN